jgi:hypothetical protein
MDVQFSKSYWPQKQLPFADLLLDVGIAELMATILNPDFR